MMTEKKTIGVVGLWHLGCVVSACWSKLGYKVIGYDENASIVDSLQKGMPPIYEPHLESTLQTFLKDSTLKFSKDVQALNDCEFIFLTYDTPVLEDDGSDISILERNIDQLGKVLKNNSVVIISSQLPVGTCRLFRERIQKINPTLDIAYSPENLQLGNAIQNYLNPGRIILGTENKTTKQRIIELFQDITRHILTMNMPSAETVKHGINSFLATSITLTNQLADVCEYSGASIVDVVKGMKSDSRIGEKAYLAPGIGFSGGTLGRDLKALDSMNESYQGSAQFFKTVHGFNQQRKIVIV